MIHHGATWKGPIQGTLLQSPFAHFKVAAEPAPKTPMMGAGMCDLFSKRAALPCGDYWPSGALHFSSEWSLSL